MSFVFLILAALFMLGVVGSMLVGFASMAQDGDAARKRSNKMMWWRVAMQGAAIGCLMIGLMLR